MASTSPRRRDRQTSDLAAPHARRDEAAVAAEAAERALAGLIEQGAATALKGPELANWQADVERARRLAKRAHQTLLQAEQEVPDLVRLALDETAPFLETEAATREALSVAEAQASRLNWDFEQAQRRLQEASSWERAPHNDGGETHRRAQQALEVAKAAFASAHAAAARANDTETDAKEAFEVARRARAEAEDNPDRALRLEALLAARCDELEAHRRSLADRAVNAESAVAEASVSLESCEAELARAEASYDADPNQREAFMKARAARDAASARLADARRTAQPACSERDAANRRSDDARRLLATVRTSAGYCRSVCSAPVVALINGARRELIAAHAAHAAASQAFEQEARTAGLVGASFPSLASLNERASRELREALTEDGGQLPAGFAWATTR